MFSGHRLLVVGLCGTALACSSESGERSNGDGGGEALAFTAMTFNTGISMLPGEQGMISDQWYGNGVAVPEIIAETRAFFDGVDVDVIGFQEIFHTDDCADIPPRFHAGFVCETHQPGDPTVARMLIGDDWQIACQLAKNDECLAVQRSFGTFRDCDDDLCLEGLAGGRVDGCGSGSRVGRGVVDLVGGGEMTVVNFHGTSGVTSEDSGCRAKQVAQVFDDLGDGAPAASGERNLIVGDFNTDPGRFTDEASAIAWNENVGDGKRFHFVSEIGPDATPSYSGLFNIDHVVSDAFDGSCWIAGISDGHPPVTEIVSYDHKPVVCDLTER